MRVREPVARPLDIVAVELLLSASQAFLVGVLLYLAVGRWEDAGVGLGSAAAVLVLLGLAIGGAWLFWLMGGVGWPLAAADVPAVLIVGFLLVMTWLGQGFEVSGAPLLLALAAAIFGVLAGVFLDSPRRWRWDQRERPRHSTRVPRLSDTTRSLVAQVPRSLPRRQPAAEPVSELAARIGAAAPSSDAAVEAGARSPEATPGPAVEEAAEPASELTDAPTVEGAPLTVPDAAEPVLPTARLGRAGSAVAAKQEETDAIQLPTMIEPRAQRSPWAWAAPPAWSRDEDDEPAGGSSGRA